MSLQKAQFTEPSSLFQTHFTAAFNLLPPLFHLIIYSGPSYVFSTVFVLTAHLCTSSLTIYILLPQFRVSHLAVGFSGPLIKQFFNRRKAFCTFNNYLQTPSCKKFRKKPAITRYDQHFTAYHISSENFATFTRPTLYSLDVVRSPGFGSNMSN